MPGRDYSQYGQQEVLVDYWKDRTGLLVDVGAWDGIFLSNSRELILRGWDAILIEPDPNVLPKLICNTFLTRTAGNVCILPLACANVSGYCTMNISPVGTTSSFGQIDEETTPHMVMLRTLGELFPKKFDLLLVDAEGSDLHVLKGVNWELNDPEMVMVEVNYVGKEKMNEYMESVGYKLYRELYIDNIYVRR